MINTEIIGIILLKRATNNECVNTCSSLLNRFAVDIADENDIVVCEVNLLAVSCD